MKSFCKYNIMHNLIIAIPILCFGIILNSCKNYLVNKDLPSPSTRRAVGITQTGAWLQGSVELEGNLTTAKFEYGTSLSYGSHTSSVSSPKGVYVIWPVTITVTDLNPGTTYHFRLVATNGNGTTNGYDQTFTTLN
jgi:hypothetical protein